MTIPRLRQRTGVRGKLRTPAAAGCALAAPVFGPPTRRTRHFVMRDAPRITKWRALDSQTPICQFPAMETPASSFKLRATAPEGRKRFPISKKAQCQLHQYGKGSFCRFRIPGKITVPGVYLIMTQKTVLYIGRCQNLAQRFNAGYGQIFPRNCYIGGQQQNCRINKLILAAIKKGMKLDLYFHQTDEFCALEARLLVAPKPTWNLV